MIAGAIGITAFVAAAQQLQERGLNDHLYYAVRSSDDIAFLRDLEPLGRNFTILDPLKRERLSIRKSFSNPVIGRTSMSVGQTD